MSLHNEAWLHKNGCHIVSEESQVLRINPASGEVETIVGSVSGDGVLNSANFVQPLSISVVSDDSMALVADSGNNEIRTIDLPTLSSAWAPALALAPSPGTQCHACRAESYKSLSGNHSCTACPAGKYNLWPASESADACVQCPLHSHSIAGSWHQKNRA